MAKLNSKFGKLADEMTDGAEWIVEKIARDVEAEAKARSRVDTGTMRNAWRVEDPIHETDSHIRKVVNGVEYAVHNELGTVKKPAQPMLVPAMERQRPIFQKAISKLLKP